MTDPPQGGPNSEPGDEKPAGDLGRSLDAFMGREWELDVNEVELAPPVIASVTPEPPEAEPVSAAAAEADVPPSPLRIVEAMLFVGGPPLTAAHACEVVRGLTEGQFLEAVETLDANYRKQGRPYVVQSHDHGYVLALRPRFRPVIEKLYGAVREARLSTAAIDVLALVAYRQPATKQEVDSIRGADSGALLRQLVRRRLIAVVQRAEATQKEVAYGTTTKFLHFFGLGSLDDLPQTQDLQQL